MLEHRLHPEIFAEQPELASRYARRTRLANDVLESVALALGGRPGSRMTGQLAVPTSRTTLVRIIRRIPEQPIAVPEVLGVDDFAIRKGQNYATILPGDQPRLAVDNTLEYEPRCARLQQAATALHAYAASCTRAVVLSNFIALGSHDG